MAGKDRDVFILKMKSIIMGVGPNKCGKTYMLKNVLVPQLSKEIELSGLEPNIKYLSSEDIRRWLMNDDIKRELHTRDERMLNSSKSAFVLLEAQLREVLEPVFDTHFVVLDTTGMNKDFQVRVLDLAKEFSFNVYYVLFDYKNRSDYFKMSSESRADVSRSVMRFKKEILGGIPVGYKRSHKIMIRAPDENAVFIIEDLMQFRDSYLDRTRRYLVMANIDYESCIEIILKCGFRLNGDRLLRGDADLDIIICSSCGEEDFDVIWKANRDLMRLISNRSEVKCYNYVPFKSDNLSKSFSVDLAVNGDQICFIGGQGVNRVKYIGRWVGKHEEKKVDLVSTLENLDSEKKLRIEKLIAHRVNFISGTVCPADKNEHILEDPIKAFLYYYNIYQSTGSGLVKSLSVQVKYMGSRFQFYYFHLQPEKCYGTTRNGFVSHIKAEHINKIYNNLAVRLREFILKYDVKTIIFDGELLPWSLLGKGLINHEFESVGHAAEKELNFLKESGFYDLSDALLKNYAESDFKKDQNEMDRTKLSKKYPNYQTLKAVSLHSKRYISSEELDKGGGVFREQMALFGTDSEVEYKPFSILKIITGAGEEHIPGISHKLIKPTPLSKLTQSEIFELITENKEDHIRITFDQSKEEAIALLMKFYKHTIVERKLEGIVIKPSIMYADFAPYLKARGSDYLHIIYGLDYLTDLKYKKLLDNKNIRKKLGVSIEEFKSGLEMLLTPMKEIDINNRGYVDNLIKYLYLEESEADMDQAL
ncbi:MAG: metallophosphoesterase [Harvfovirus sp.]|uniref:Metallophosphoesterase n=1 Tax=Harvfovirus sp. TaxID=2487768 RepID=A0A3G5A548_9VIRU|nr:MAG: metallophosphoesterase [Harvfovirus sp.]